LYLVISGNRMCPHPGIPIGGRLIKRSHRNNFGFPVDTMIEFECENGLVLEGERRQLCLRYQEWSGNGAPQCISKIRLATF